MDSEKGLFQEKGCVAGAAVKCDDARSGLVVVLDDDDCGCGWLRMQSNWRIGIERRPGNINCV